MLNFNVDKENCIKCGVCVSDCPAMIINMTDNGPIILPEKENNCFKCQHCLAVCPVGAIAILGVQPRESHPLTGELPSSEQMEMLIKGRRSIRKYKDENLDPKLIQRLLDTAWYAPTGKNTKQVQLTVVDDREVMNQFRNKAMTALSRLTKEGKLPAGLEFFADMVNAWEKNHVDVIFRGAPHMLIASAPKNGVSPFPDCIIALSYFELFAQSLGIGTIWSGLARWTIAELVPELRKDLGIPDDHIIGLVMPFGKPAVKYFRCVQHKTPHIVKVSRIQ
ncbi:MAG: nitroreductase family protein [Candidatus Omnitrophica bacterium]|nr:nitroreductase family protein [Candidatus Omnitrophota bacterium]